MGHSMGGSATSNIGAVSASATGASAAEEGRGPPAAGPEAPGTGVFDVLELHPEVIHVPGEVPDFAKKGEAC